MFALSLEDFLYLPWGLSTNIDFLYLCQKYHLKETNKIFKNVMDVENLNWVCRTYIDKVWNIFHSRFSSVAPWCLLGSNLSKHVGSHSVTTEACNYLAPVCVVWRSGSPLELSALWFQTSWFSCDIPVMVWSSQTAFIFQTFLHNYINFGWLLRHLLTESHKSRQFNSLFVSRIILSPVAIAIWVRMKCPQKM